MEAPSWGAHLRYLSKIFQYRIPDNYNADICPEALVEVEVGLFYKTLIYLDSKTSSFGMKHYLHLRWKGTTKNNQT